MGAWRFLAALQQPSPRANRARLHARGETPASLTIREATSADVDKLARLHVTTWNATYAPFGARGPGVEVREQQWCNGFQRDDEWFCLVIERADAELVGFAQGNASNNPEFGGELRKIYLLREYQRLGLGRRLVGHVARRFLSRGITSMWLCGDARNPSARAWLAMGAAKTDDDSGNGNYGWHDIREAASFPP